MVYYMSCEACATRAVQQQTTAPYRCQYCAAAIAVPPPALSHHCLPPWPPGRPCCVLPRTIPIARLRPSFVCAVSWPLISGHDFCDKTDVCRSAVRPALEHAHPIFNAKPCHSSLGIPHTTHALYGASTRHTITPMLNLVTMAINASVLAIASQAQTGHSTESDKQSPHRTSVAP